MICMGVGAVSLANAFVIHFSNAGAIGAGACALLMGSDCAVAGWGGTKSSAFAPTADYLDFKLTLPASPTAEVSVEITPNGLATPKNLKWEVGTVPGSGNVVALNSSTALNLYASGFTTGKEYYLSFQSTGAGALTAAVDQFEVTPLPGSLVLFGTILAGSGFYGRRRVWKPHKPSV